MLCSLPHSFLFLEFCSWCPYDQALIFILLSSYTLLSFLTGFFARDDLFIMLGAYKAIEYISQNRWRCNILSQKNRLER